MKTATDNDEWLGKVEAAAVLGVSVRQLELKTANGQIRKKTLPKKPNERAARVVYSREDLDAIRAGKPNQWSSAPLAPDFRHFGNTGLLRGGDPAAVLAARHMGLVPPPIAQKPWLTLQEAAIWSGLPATWLTARAREGAAFALNVAQGSKAHWRFNREALAAAR
jgi:hypothetical protein